MKQNKYILYSAYAFLCLSVIGSVSITISMSSYPEYASSKVRCSICWEKCVRSDMHSLVCGHTFCRTCIRGRVSSAFGLPGLKCLNKHCSYIITLADIQFISGLEPHIIDRIKRFTDPVTPPANLKSRVWQYFYTKPCPGRMPQGQPCGAPIEKNGGCNHMKCARCGHDFCWECLKPCIDAFDHDCFIKQPVVPVVPVVQKSVLVLGLLGSGYMFYKLYKYCFGQSEEHAQEDSSHEEDAQEIIIE